MLVVWMPWGLVGGYWLASSSSIGQGAYSIALQWAVDEGSENGEWAGGGNES